MKIPNLIFFLLFITTSLFGQAVQDIILKGFLWDKNSQEPLMYANIYVLNNNAGVITNEQGHYALDISSFSVADTIRFQYMGYQTKDIAISDLINSADVYLEENIINISETLIFGRELDPALIVQNVLMYADSNYRSDYSAREVFVRQRFESDIHRFMLNYKKSTISDIDQEALATAEQKLPRHSTSYTDFLGDILSSPNEEDSIRVKIKANRVVSLKDKDITEIDQLTQVFEDVFKKTDSLEYWKVKTGVIGGKVHFDYADTTLNLAADEMEVRSFANGLYYDLNDYEFNNEDMWNFLHKSSRYIFTLAGGTRLNGEDIYIIDFVPKNKGKYEGRLYIGLSSYALLRADFQYAEGKHGTNFKLMGINYTEQEFKVSVYFEKIEDSYQLKYFSFKDLSTFGIDRKIALLKKRKRPLFDKTLLELKSGIDVQVSNQKSFEFLVLSHDRLSENDFINFEENKKMKVIYVNQFDDSLWQGYDILEPTKKMREYQKIIYN